MNHSPARTAPDCADRPHAAANSGSTSPHPYTPLLRTPLVSSDRSGHCRDKSSQSIDPPQDAPEQIPAYGNFGRLERDVAALSDDRSEEHTSELQSLMRISYAVFCLKKKIIVCVSTNLQRC